MQGSEKHVFDPVMVEGNFIWRIEDLSEDLERVQRPMLSIILMMKISSTILTFPTFPKTWEYGL